MGISVGDMLATGPLIGTYSFHAGGHSVIVDELELEPWLAETVKDMRRDDAEALRAAVDKGATVIAEIKSLNRASEDQQA